MTGRRALAAAAIIAMVLVVLVGPGRIRGWFGDDGVTGELGQQGSDAADGAPVPAGSQAPFNDPAGPAGTSAATAGPGDGRIRAVPPPDGVGLATVDHVTDGDTLWLDIPEPVGDGSSGEVKTRLLRIDAPELSHDGRPEECAADAAHARLVELLPEGSQILVGYDVDPRDQYGRDLVHLWTLDGTWINGQLLAEGLARAVTFAPNDAYDSQVWQLESVARSDNVGMWACER